MKTKVISLIIVLILAVSGISAAVLYVMNGGNTSNDTSADDLYTGHSVSTYNNFGVSEADIENMYVGTSGNSMYFCLSVLDDVITSPITSKIYGSNTNYEITYSVSNVQEQDISDSFTVALSETTGNTETDVTTTEEKTGVHFEVENELNIGGGFLITAEDKLTIGVGLSHENGKSNSISLSNNQSMVSTEDYSKSVAKKITSKIDTSVKIQEYLESGYWYMWAFVAPQYIIEKVDFQEGTDSELYPSSVSYAVYCGEPGLKLIKTKEKSDFNNLVNYGKENKNYSLTQKQIDTALAMYGAELDVEHIGFQHIQTAEQLKNITDGRYVLDNDLEIDYLEWVPISSFSGIIDGDNHVISGLNINDPSVSNIGLFNNLDHAIIRNLAMDHVNVSHTQDESTCGIISSNAVSSKFSNIIVLGDVNIDSNDSTIGIIAGTAVDSIFDNIVSSVDCNIYWKNSAIAGGIVGDGDNCHLSNIVVLSKIELTKMDAAVIGDELIAGGCIGMASDCRVENAISNSSIDAYILYPTNIRFSVGSVFGNISGQTQITNTIYGIDDKLIEDKIGRDVIYVSSTELESVTSNHLTVDDKNRIGTYDMSGLVTSEWWCDLNNNADSNLFWKNGVLWYCFDDGRNYKLSALTQEDYKII